MPTAWVGLIASPWSGRLAQRFGARLPALLAGTLITVSWALLAIKHDSLWVVVTIIGSASFGYAVMYAAIPNLILERAPTECTSEATGVAAVIRSLFMAVGAQVVTLVLAGNSTVVQGALRYSTDGDFTLAFTCIASFGALCTAAAYAISPGFRWERSITA